MSCFESRIALIDPMKKTTTRKMNKPADSPVMTVQEAARFLGVSRKSLHTYRERGLVPFTRIGSRVLFHRDKLDALVRGDLQMPTQP